eukprot:11378380-Alexandrium_andersonii.AAC.1
MEGTPKSSSCRPCTSGGRRAPRNGQWRGSAGAQCLPCSRSTDVQPIAACACPPPSLSLPQPASQSDVAEGCARRTVRGRGMVGAILCWYSCCHVVVLAPHEDPCILVQRLPRACAFGPGCTRLFVCSARVRRPWRVQGAGCRPTTGPKVRGCHWACRLDGA